MSSATQAQRQFKRFVAYPLQALLVYAFFGFFKILPIDTASAVGGWIGRTIAPRLGVSKKVRRNLAAAMPELDRMQQDTIIRDMWDNLGRIMAEYAHLGELDESRVELVGAEEVLRLHHEGKPVLFASGHFGNWEVLPVTLERNNFNAQLVYRHANNPYVEKLMQRARSPGGTRFARKGVAGARSVHGALRNNEVVAMLVDQKHNRGLPIPFFGRPAMTAQAIAELALKYKTPPIMARCERLHGAHFRVTVAPAMAIEGLSVEEILTRINKQLEEWVRSNPAQWLWLHRRWND